MASKEPIPIQAGDSSTVPTAQPMTMVPFDTDAQVDTDMGFILDLQKRNEELEEEEEAALAGQIVEVGSSSSYGPASMPPSRTTGNRTKYDMGPKKMTSVRSNLALEVFR